MTTEVSSPAAEVLGAKETVIDKKSEQEQPVLKANGHTEALPPTAIKVVDVMVSEPTEDTPLEDAAEAVAETAEETADALPAVEEPAVSQPTTEEVAEELPAEEPSTTPAPVEELLPSTPAPVEELLPSTPAPSQPAASVSKTTPEANGGHAEAASAAQSPATPAIPIQSSPPAEEPVSNAKQDLQPPLTITAPGSPPREAEILSPSISVKELRKQLSSAASPAAPTPGKVTTASSVASPAVTPVPTPGKAAAGSSLTSPSGTATSATTPAATPGAPLTSPTASSVPRGLQSQRSTKEAVVERMPPVEARSTHDQRNTTNAAQLLKLGAFKLQPLKDFVAYDELIKLRLEDGIDPTRKEDYLTEEEFKTVMGMSRDEFTKMPAWRKTNAKKNKLLF